MKINREIILCLIPVFLMVGCVKKATVFGISDQYTGPSIIFIYSDNSIDSKSNLVFNGLGRINEKDLGRRFEFQSLEKKTVISIIPIGKENNVDENVRCIFQLLKGTSNYNYLNKDIYSINFFIGKREDFSKWSQQNSNMFNYFDKIGVDWETFYLKTLN